MWKVGQRVFGQKRSEQYWYAGTVRHIDAERCYVIFDDGDDALVEPECLKALDLHVGDRLLARLPMEADFKPAKVLAWDDEKVQVQWANGEEDWTSQGMVRLSSKSLPEQPAFANQAWQDGARVFACWHDLFWYPGVVISNTSEGYHVLFDHGNQAFVGGDRIKPLEFAVGDHVFCRRGGGPEFLACEITKRNGEVIHVCYEDGVDEATSVRLVRLLHDDWFPPAEAVDVQPGQRVLGCWFDSHWYPGVILSVEGKRVHMLFDDGDQALLTPDKLRPLNIDVDSRVWCRRNGGPIYYGGEVVRKDGEVIHIQYDDGDEETTSVRLVRIQTESNANLGPKSN